MNEPDKAPDRDSKSQRKRQMLALQDLGLALVELPLSALKQIPLEDKLKEAIFTARELPNREAKRRQLQYIGKLMRNFDTQPIQAALHSLRLKDQLQTLKFHQIERWRNQLLSQGDAALEEFLVKCPTADSQHLRQLIRQAQKDLATDKNSGASTALFRYLSDLLNA